VGPTELRHEQTVECLRRAKRKARVSVGVSGLSCPMLDDSRMSARISGGRAGHLCLALPAGSAAPARAASTQFETGKCQTLCELLKLGFPPEEERLSNGRRRRNLARCRATDGAPACCSA
jgi:hypothetical protein